MTELADAAEALEARKTSAGLVAEIAGIDLFRRLALGLDLDAEEIAGLSRVYAIDLCQSAQAAGVSVVDAVQGSWTEGFLLGALMVHRRTEVAS